MELINERGERRAGMDLARLKDLWFMWSFCNLECTHCYVGSSPRNRTLELLTLEDVIPFLMEARDLGVEHVYFTGGEPFADPEIVDMIEAALRIGAVTVLTNGVGPIARRFDDLSRLRERLTIRVSLDHFDPARHDAVRGAGAFRSSVSTVRELRRRGVRVVVTATPLVFEGTSVTRDEAIAEFESLFAGLDVAIKLLPATLQLGAEVRRTGAPEPVPFLTERQMRNARPADFQCRTSRCVQKIAGRLRVYPCPIIYDDPEFELGSTLRESFRRVYLGHHGCVNFCYRHRGKCGDEQLVARAEQGP
ncbi:MAG: radical SAM protein [Planctomycetes bacterium]|nr:radical SAM protein [Planctomycetota bacterium]